MSELELRVAELSALQGVCATLALDLVMAHGRLANGRENIRHVEALEREAVALHRLLSRIEREVEVLQGNKNHPA